MTPWPSPAEMNRQARVCELLDDVCRRAGGIHDNPSLDDFAEMLAKHGFVLAEAANPLDGTRLWRNS